MVPLLDVLKPHPCKYDSLKSSSGAGSCISSASGLACIHSAGNRFVGCIWLAHGNEVGCGIGIGSDIFVEFFDDVAACLFLIGRTMTSVCNDCNRIRDLCRSCVCGFC